MDNQNQLAMTSYKAHLENAFFFLWVLMMIMIFLLSVII